MKKIGAGRTAEVFEYDENKILKLFYKDKPESEAKKEFANLKIANSLLIPSPIAYELIKKDERFGIVEERFFGQDGLDVLLKSDTPADFIQQMSTLQQKLNSQEFSDCISYKDSLKNCLWSCNSTSEKKSLYEKIDALPEGNNLCHGDFHPGNVLVKEDGSQILIDLMNLCHGPRLYDVARTYFLISNGELPPELSPSQLDFFKATRKKLADVYLSSQATQLEELSQFLEVISAIRKYELI